MKKIILFICLVLFSLFSMNATTTYLSSCPGVIATSNVHYYLNFTQINIATCFQINQNVELQNITIEGMYPIDVKFDGGRFFFKTEANSPTDGNRYIQDINFKNLEFFSSLDYSFNEFIQMRSGSSRAQNHWDGGVLENITFNMHLNNFFYHYIFDCQAGFANNCRGHMYNINMTDIYAPDVDDFSFGKYQTPLTPPVFNKYNFIVRDSFINVHNNRRTGDLAGNVYEYDWDWFDSVFTLDDLEYGEDYNTTTQVYNNDYTSSIIKGVLFPDVNDDGVGEITTETQHFSPAIFKDLFGVRFLQDINEGRDVFSVSITNVPINDEIIGSTAPQGPTFIPFLPGMTLDTSLVTHTYTDSITNLQFLSGSNGANYICLFDGFCNVNNGLQTSILSFKFKGIYTLQSSDHRFEGINFHRNGTTNANIIANFDDVTYSNITVDTNVFNLETGTKGTNATDSVNTIKLKANQVRVSNNIFDLISSTSTDEFEFLYIDGTSPTTNKVYLNDFQNSIGSPTGTSEVFTHECDAQFYNNRLENDIVITSSSCGSLNATPLIGFNHTDGKVYYYNLGNFYVDNVGCTDGDVDGFCDSSYTSGNITDTKPLSSWPFDYASHLLTADLVVDSTSFNITLVEPTNNESIVVSGASSPIAFTFSHDSDFPDLQCDYVIDGAVVGGASINPALGNINHSTNLTGWTEKSYTFRIECYNDIAFEASTEIDFIVSFTGVPPVDDDEGGEFAGLFSEVSFIDSESKVGTATDVVGFFENLMNFSLNWIIPFIMFFLVVLAILAIFIMVS